MKSILITQCLQNDFVQPIAMLRYAMHTLSFDECNEWQKKLALYCGSICCEKARRFLAGSRKLRIDYVSSPQKQIAGNGLIGITILPGRKDRSRNLQEDIGTIKDEGIGNIVCLLSENEFYDYGVPELEDEYRKNGFDVHFLSIVDQGVCTKEQMTLAVDWLQKKTVKGEKTLIHCVGGLGRSGMLAACFHKRYSSLNAEEAIALVRECRSQRAVENQLQEDFVRNF